MLFRGIVLVPAGLYVAGCLLTAAISASEIGARGRRPWPGLVLALLAFSLVYSGLYFPRAFSGLVALGSIAALPVHVLFWHLAYHSPPYTRWRERFFKDLWIGLFAAFGFGLVNALGAVGWRIEPGAVHDLDRSSAFVRSDLDVPLLAVALAVWAATFTVFRRRVRDGTGDEVRWVPRSTAGIVGVLAILALILYARRAPMLALGGAIALLAAPTTLGSRMYYAAALLPAIPLAWGTAVKILIAVTQNPVANALIARNDLESYVTATNRLATWIRSLDFITDFRLSHIWGYGTPPGYLLPPGLGWLHVHNAFMELFFEAGLLALAIAVLILLATFRRLGWLLRSRRQIGRVLPIFGFLWAWTAIAAVEPSLRSYSLVHLLFLTFGVVTANMYHAERLSDGDASAVAMPLAQSAGTSR